MRRTPGERLEAARRAFGRKLAAARGRRRVNVAGRVNAVVVGNVGHPGETRGATSGQRVEIRQSD